MAQVLGTRAERMYRHAQRQVGYAITEERREFWRARRDHWLGICMDELVEKINAAA